MQDIVQEPWAEAGPSTASHCQVVISFDQRSDSSDTRKLGLWNGWFRSCASLQQPVAVRWGDSHASIDCHSLGQLQLGETLVL
jgi:hypothetical protein